jgi:hypothetical protein
MNLETPIWVVMVIVLFVALIAIAAFAFRVPW